MLDLNAVREDLEFYKYVCKSKNVDLDVDYILELDNKRKELQQQIDGLKYKQKELAKEGKYDQAKSLKEEIQTIEKKYEENKTVLDELLLKMPNFMHPDTPIGEKEEDNVIVRTIGEKTSFDFDVKDHMDLSEMKGWIDKDTASKVSGARFAYIRGDLVLLQMAIVNFVFATLGDEDILKSIIKEKKLNISSKPFVPILPPSILRMDVMNKMGRLHPMDDRYCLHEDKQVLNGSAEHTMGPMFMDSILKEEELPLRFIGYSTSFRREAGTYGKDTRGIFRMHQFDKLEMETFTLPELGEDEQELLLGLQEYMMQQLGLPYQVVLKCSADMGSVDYRGIDIETWMPGQNKYRETHTSDRMTDFQARRLNTKVKRLNGEKEYVHMNDATAFALGRIMIAILENYQTKEGNVKIPEPLQKYVGKSLI